MNRGHTAIVTDIEYRSEDFVFNNRVELPMEISKWDVLSFLYKPKDPDKSIENCRSWKPNIYYQDKY